MGVEVTFDRVYQTLFVTICCIYNKTKQTNIEDSIFFRFRQQEEQSLDWERSSTIVEIPLILVTKEYLHLVLTRIVLIFYFTTYNLSLRRYYIPQIIILPVETLV